MLWLLFACECGPGEETGWDTENGEACVSCHEGVEKAHPVVEACTDCHGGDGTALNKDKAHVPVPENWESLYANSGLAKPAPDGFIKNMPPDMLDQLDPAYVRFINPGDLRAAPDACGSCHEDIVNAVETSVMSTNTGHYMPTRFYAGLQGREALYASTEIGGLDVLRPDGEALQTAIDEEDWAGLQALALDHYLAKNCNTCHAAGYPKNNSKALYRSTGCTSCHMNYGEEGIYQGDDPTIPNAPPHAEKHELTSAITVEQCSTCHFQGGRIGLNFRGIREGGFSPDQTPENALFWNDNVYGHVPGFYIFDEDTTNSVDETPPDLHYQAGMVCVDCHVGSDVHGDGIVHSTSKQQLDLRCEDCHGTVRQTATPDSDGVYTTLSGRTLPQLYTNDAGQVALTGRIDGVEHVVPQPALLLEERGDESLMHRGMGTDDDDWSHTDSLTCDTCHNSWQLQCLGCHVNVNVSVEQTNYQTGEKTAGFTTGGREWFSLDDIVLCQEPGGRAQSCNSSQQLQLTVTEIDDGEIVPVLGDEDFTGLFRSTPEHDAIIGWSPFFQHTTSARPRTCTSCHRTDDTPEEYARVRGVYGYGTGEFMLDNPEGDPVDALQFLDDEGNPTTLFVHEGSGPLAPEVIERALGVDLEN
jgi:hypothetical protein